MCSYKCIYNDDENKVPCACPGLHDLAPSLALWPHLLFLPWSCAVCYSHPAPLLVPHTSVCLHHRAFAHALFLECSFLSLHMLAPSWQFKSWLNITFLWGFSWTLNLMKRPHVSLSSCSIFSIVQVMDWSYPQLFINYFSFYSMISGVLLTVYN